MHLPKYTVLSHFGHFDAMFRVNKETGSFSVGPPALCRSVGHTSEDGDDDGDGRDGAGDDDDDGSDRPPLRPLLHLHSPAFAVTSCSYHHIQPRVNFEVLYLSHFFSYYFFFSAHKTCDTSTAE